ncbi:MAG: hypothetical protein ACPHJ1_10360, partial [Ilumatobacteraceae bacterium]
APTIAPLHPIEGDYALTVVSGDDRVSEIARLLAGTDGPRAVEHARELLGSPSSTGSRAGSG